MAIFLGTWQKQEERKLMRAKIKKAPVAKVGKQPKSKKIEVPAVKTAKKELSKAEKKLSLAKAALIVARKKGIKK